MKYSAAVANQTGVSFESLVGYIATVSSATRLAPEMIGTAFKTIMTRMQQVTSGQEIEDGTDLNKVEKVLGDLGISIRDATDSFRPLEDVIDDVGKKWGELNEVQQAQIANTIAGKQQITIFTSLMQNYGEVTKYVAEQTTSAGLANERYAIYLESVEAAQNRLTASWERMWQKTLESGAITFFLDFASAILDGISAVGGLKPVLMGILGVMLILKREAIALAITTGWKAISQSVMGLIAAFRGLAVQATATGAAVNLSLGYIGIALTVLSAAFMIFSGASEATLRNLEKLSGEISGLYNEISTQKSDLDQITTLGDRYLELQKITERTAEETKEFTDIQNKLKDILPQLTGEYDAQGNFLLENVDNLGTLLNLKQKEIDINKELLNQKLYEQTKLQTENYQDQTKAMEDLITKSKSKGRGGLNMYDISAEDIANQRLATEEAFNQIQQNFLSLSSEQQQSILRSLNESGDEFKKQLREDLINLIQSEPIPVPVRLQYENVSEETKPLEDYFNTLMSTASDTMSGEGKEKFDNFATTIGQLNQQFEEGKLGGEQYFSSLKSGLEGMNLEEMFGGNTEGAQAFFTGIVSNAANSMTLLNTQFDTGKITLEEYINQLTLLGGVFETIGSMTTDFASTLGLPASQIAEIQSAVDGALGNITSGISELQGMQELNMAVQNAWVEQTAGSLQFGTEAYAQYMTQIAELAGMANQTITDVQGNVISGSANIRSWLMADAGNFSIMANQTAKKTGESIQKLVQGAGTLLSTLGQSIKNFTFKISFTPDIRDSGQTLDILGIKFPIPTLDLNITGSGNDAVANIGQAISDFGNTLASSDFNFDASSLYGAGAAPSASSNPFKPATTGASGLSNALDNASSSAKDLADNLKDVKKEAIDSLKAQLKGYKDLIDARKKMLDSMAEERDYQNQVEEKNDEILKIQTEIATLQFDNSEEAQARRLQLEDDLAEMQGQLEDIQFDYSINQQKDALDAEYQAFESSIENAINQVQGIQATNLQQFAQKLSVILSGIGTPPVPQFHSGVEMGAVGSQFTMKSNEMFAKLLKGEVVVTPQQMDGFMKTTLPALKEGSSSFSGGDINIDMPISVQGNLDKSVLPDLERLTETLMGKINEKMMQRGWNRRADLYSI